MLNSKRTCPFEDDESRPSKKPSLNTDSNQAKKHAKPQPKEQAPIHIPIPEETLDQIKAKVEEAMTYLDDAFELGKVVERKYTKEILSSMGLLKVFLQATKASDKPSPAPMAKKKVSQVLKSGSASKAGSRRAPRRMPFQGRTTQRPDTWGFSRNGSRPMRGYQWNEGPSWRTPYSQISSSFLPPGSRNNHRGGWGSRGSGSTGRGGWAGARWGRGGPPQRTYSCNLCRVECSNIEHYTVHIAGKAHQKKLKNKPSLQGEGEKSTSFHCKVCNINCSGKDPWKAHLSGKKHAVNSGKPVPITRPQPGGKFFCSICNVDCTAQTQWNTHMKGKKHTAKLAAM